MSKVRLWLALPFILMGSIFLFLGITLGGKVASALFLKEFTKTLRRTQNNQSNILENGGNE